MLSSILAILVTLHLAQTPAGTISPGSTRQEVQIVLGTPTTTKGNIWHYGTSLILFDSHGNLAGYVVGDTNLQVVIPVNNERETPSFLQTGSTKDDVAQLLGAPTVLGPLTWSYGTSQISFNKDGVAEWFLQGIPTLPLAPSAQDVPPLPVATNVEADQVRQGRTRTVTTDAAGTPILTLKGEYQGPYISPFLPQPTYSPVEQQYDSPNTPSQSDSLYSYGDSSERELPVLDDYGAISQVTGRPKTVHVKGYTRKDGTYVRPYVRSPARR